MHGVYEISMFFRVPILDLFIDVAFTVAYLDHVLHRADSPLNII